MEKIKEKILQHICYTELVYGRIRKKLSINLSDSKIEDLMHITITETPTESIIKRGKNYYIQNCDRNIQITINSHTTRVITADRIIGVEPDPPTPSSGNQ